MNQKKSKKIPYKFAAGVLVLLLGILALNGLYLLYRKRVETNVSRQTDKAMMDTTHFSAGYLAAFFDTSLKQLRLMSSFCDVPDGSGAEDWWSIISQADTQDYRMSVADSRGTAYYGDRKTADMSEKAYYQAAMRGEQVVTEVLRDEFNGGDAVVVAVPIWRFGKTRACVVIQYSTIYIGERINTIMTENAGTALVMDRNGYLVASYEGMERYDTFYDMLATMKFKLGESEQTFKELVDSNDDGFFTYYGADGKGKARYIYFEKLGEQDWVIITLVLKEKFQSLPQEILGDTVMLLFGELALVICMAAALLYIRHLWKEEQEIHRRDLLTGAYTREGAREILRQVSRSRARNGKYFSGCLFLDVDHFKEINDTLGHDEGDLVLKEVAGTLLESVRRNDIVSRYGGDEFNVWLYGIKEERQLREAAERILQNIRKNGRVTISMGGIMAGADEDYEEALKRADQALYRAKESGRDRYCIWKEADRSAEE